MKTVEIIRTSIGVVSVLFGAFASFLVKIAPPEIDFLAIGFSSIIAIGISLLIKSIIKISSRNMLKRIFYIIACISLLFMIILSIIYVGQWRNYVYNCPENSGEKYIAGAKMTEQAQEINRKFKYNDNSKLAFEFACSKEDVWEKDSIKYIEYRFYINYTAIVILFALMVFCSTEGILSKANEDEKGE